MILLIDSYDSFSHNLCRLIEGNTNHQVITIFNDTFAPEEYERTFENWIRFFDYIVIGPGPGHPAERKDVGIIHWLYQHFASNPKETVPILGVCLGFQSLCLEFGNKVERLESVKHGQIYDVIAQPSDLFPSGTPAFPSVRYHSLHVRHDNLNENIVPLAICKEEDGGTILMAGRHKTLPLYGVQYHPESICSKRGDLLIRQFNEIASAYNAKERPNLLKDQENHRLQDETIARTRAVHDDCLIPSGTFKSRKMPKVYVKQFSFQYPDTKPIDICDYLSSIGTGFVFLNSAADPGDWSIIGLPIEKESEVITHSIDNNNIVRLLKYRSSEVEVKPTESLMKFVAEKMESLYISRNDITSQIGSVYSKPFPFFGGYMGLFSYEEGKHLVVDNMEPICNDYTPDCKLVFIERFILYDRTTLTWFLVSIRDSEDEHSVCDDIVTAFENAQEDFRIDIGTIHSKVKDYCDGKENDIEYQFPDREIYRKQFELCQEYLHSGDSYELCLTTLLKVKIPASVDPWTMYKILALRKNPSPYLCFMEFDDCVLLSSSPERFLSWRDSDKVEGRKMAELRPIKGTVKNTESTSLEDATKILRTPKEMGENLMIVDLIRHDLQTFTDSVEVEALMKIEEYKTVYQMVTVIQGHLPESGYKGIDILQLSLPPGSMTGAPKKRSVELLQSIESMQPTMNSSGRRGIYSGVAGYWSVTDDADWSVIIRSMVHYKKDQENTEDRNVWRIGAGGAITVLSEEEGEWEEMHLKLNSTLQTFI